MPEQITVIIVALFAGSVPALLSLWFGRRKVAAEEKDIITQAAERAVKIVQGRLDEQCQQNDELRRELDRLKVAHEQLRDEFDGLISGAIILHDQIIEMDGEPRYKPPERRRK